jgi:hypothetical protein
MTEQKLCCNCKYYQGNWDISDRCMHPDAQEINIVSGFTYQQPCSWMRSNENKCGTDAVWFETYTGNRDWDNFFQFTCVVAATLLFVAAVIYMPTFIMGMMNR